MKTSSRPGFTFYELLILLAIGASLLSLFFPAVARMRMSAVRSASANNMKQIALACHNYHDQQAHLPPGNDANNFSAAAKLLPDVEQDAVSQRTDFTKSSTGKENEGIRKLRILVFLDPQDPVKEVSPESGATNYLFCAGAKPSLTDNNGVFLQDSKVKLTEISDGTSNTILIGETLKGDGGAKAVDVRRQHVKLGKDALNGIKDEAGVDDFKASKNIASDRCSAWIDGRFLQGTFTGTRIANDPRPDVSCDGMGGLSALRGQENGVIQIGLCDGSVRTVNTAIKLEVWKALAGKDDGQPIPDLFDR